MTLFGPFAPRSIVILMVALAISILMIFLLRSTPKQGITTRVCLLR